MEMATISLASLKSSVAPVGPFIAFLHNPLTSAMSAQFPYQAMQFSSSASSPLVGSESSPRLIQNSTLGPYQPSRNISSFVGSSSSMFFRARTVIATQDVNSSFQ
jgi:hypothetical protein